MLTVLKLSLEGREYDEKGNLHEWWQNSTIDKFKEKMKCFEEQYSRYQIGKDHVSVVNKAMEIEYIVWIIVLFCWRFRENKLLERTWPILVDFPPPFV